MDSISYKTASLNQKTANKGWVVIDAKDQVLGRMTTQIAMIIRGKHKAGFTPHMDCGDNVIVINASQLKFTGRKMNMKEYVRYTGYPGGQRFATPADWMKKNPALIVEHAVRGMLPKTKLGKALFGNLFVYNDEKHPHQAQNPKAIKIKN